MANTTVRLTAVEKIGIAADVFRKVAWRLIPFMILLYFVAFLDRINIGIAALTMNKDLGISATAYGNAAGIFFLGYFLFEVPSISCSRRSVRADGSQGSWSHGAFSLRV